MGDYTKTGVKIGTCGRAYYATKKMLQDISTDPEAAYYLNPKNACSFAFPFPEYDGLKVGEISNFHEGQRVEYFFKLPKGNGIHGQIVHHVHPNGGEGINLFIDCPYTEGSKVSQNFKPDFETFRLMEECYNDGKLSVVCSCIYCEKRQILEPHEIELAAVDFDKQAEKMERQSAMEKREYPDCINWEYSVKAANNLKKVAERLRDILGVSKVAI